MFFTHEGTHTKQAHKGIPEGHVEEEQGRKGFYGAVSHLLRPKAPTRWKTIEGNLRPRMYDLVKTEKGGKRQRILFNSDINIFTQWIDPVKNTTLTAFRSADGDLIYFCHLGKGDLLTEYGWIPYRPGDYLVIPKCVGHTFLPAEQSQFLLLENLSGDYREPDRGVAGRNAIYDTAQLEKPNLEKQQDILKSRGLQCLNIEVKHSEEITRFGFDACVYDAIGWKGDLFPFKLNMDQIMPLMSHRSHLPPSAHTTFVAPNFVVCSFVPRPFESDADALRVPFYHQNIDYDEVLFYHNGDFFSRNNLHAGMLSFHPAGFPHGPHPQAFVRVKNATHTNEYAVMVDTRKPLHRDSSISALEIQEYWKSWQG